MTNKEKQERFDELYIHLKMALAWCESIKTNPINQPDMAKKINGQIAKAQSAGIQFQIAITSQEM